MASTPSHPFSKARPISSPYQCHSHSDYESRQIRHCLSIPFEVQPLLGHLPSELLFLPCLKNPCCILFYYCFCMYRRRFFYHLLNTILASRMIEIARNSPYTELFLSREFGVVHRPRIKTYLWRGGRVGGLGCNKEYG